MSEETKGKPKTDAWSLSEDIAGGTPAQCIGVANNRARFEKNKGHEVGTDSKDFNRWVNREGYIP